MTCRAGGATRPASTWTSALTADDGYRAERSYSIASAPGEPVAITVERLDDGEVSPYLTEDVQIGDEIEVRGPIGGYFIWDPPVSGDGPLLLAAGGSGVVPLRAIIRHRCLVGSSVPVRLLYSVRSQAEVIYRSELDHLNQEADGVKVIYTLTRQQPPGWTGYARRVDQQMMAEVAWPVASGLAAQVASAPSASAPWLPRRWLPRRGFRAAGFRAAGFRAAGLRVRADELCGGGGLGPGGARLPAAAGQDREVRRDGHPVILFARWRSL